MRYTIAALLYPDALATSISLPMEIFHGAAQMAQRHGRKHSVNIVLASEQSQSVTLSHGLPLQADCHWSALDNVHLIILPAIWRNPLRALRKNEGLIPWLKHWHKRGITLCSVGSASFFLAEAGLLSHRNATTHWQYYDLFAKRYPQVHLKRRHLITQADEVFCTGSVNSIADFAVHQVQNWFGAPIARAVENQFSPEIRHAYHSPSAGHHDELVLLAQTHLRENANTPPTINKLADQLGVSTRTLNRRFKEAVGITPLEYLQNIRMESARELLSQTNLTVGEIAWQLGFQDAGYFSRLFLRHRGLSPLAYRQAVRPKQFEVTVSS